MDIIKKIIKAPFPLEIKKLLKKSVKQRKVGIEYIDANVIDINIFNISILTLFKGSIYDNFKKNKGVTY